MNVKDVQGALRLQNKMFEAQTAKKVNFFYVLFALFTLCFDRELAPAVLQVGFLFFVFFFFFCQISIDNLSLDLDLSLILIIEIVDLFCNLNTFLVVIIGMFQRNLNKEDNPIN